MHGIRSLLRALVALGVVVLIGTAGFADVGVIARAERDEEVRKLRRAGADRIVSPFRSGGVEIAHAILRFKVADFLARSAETEGDLALAEIVVEAGSALADCPAVEAPGPKPVRLALVALERPDEPTRIPPPADAVLHTDDVLIVAGDPAEIVRLRDRARAR